MDLLSNIMNYFMQNGIYMLGTAAVILVLSLVIVICLKLNYKDLWVSKPEYHKTYTQKLNA